MWLHAAVKSAVGYNRSVLAVCDRSPRPLTRTAHLAHRRTDPLLHGANHFSLINDILLQ